MDSKDVKIFKRGGVKRPSNSKKIRLLFELHRMPVIHKFVKKHLLKALGLPMTTAINQGFYCSAPNLKVDNYTGLGNTFILAWAPVTIGTHCSFSYDNKIITSTHDFADFSTVIGKPVTIGDYVWVTSNVTILPGVTIGSHTVIGAGSVVSRDIPAGVFAAGNPCRVIKKINFRPEK